MLYCCVKLRHGRVLFCTVLCCTVLCCAVLYCTVLCCTVLYCTVLYCTVLCCTVLHCTVLYCAVLYCAVLYCTGEMLSVTVEMVSDLDATEEKKESVLDKDVLYFITYKSVASA